MVGMVVSTIVLAGAYRLWKTHEEQGHQLTQKINIRNEMTLSSKRIQRSVTLAGLGLGGAANLAKEDAVGSDTLVIYTNPNEDRSVLVSDYIHVGSAVVHVAEPSKFSGARYLAIKSATSGEIRKIVGMNSSIVMLESPFQFDYPAATSAVFPATRERFYSNQEAKALMREAKDGSIIVAKNVTNFQVSFRNKHGESTEIVNEVRTVVFSFTGVFDAREGALNSIVFSSTAIPRNTL
jgi:hypothetical protein